MVNTDTSKVYWYRVEGRMCSVILDEYDNYGSSPEVYVRKYEMLKETAKGVWLWAEKGKRFVLREARKRYACPTVEEAYESFYARKARQISILKARIAEIEQIVGKAQMLQGRPFKGVAS